MPNHLYKTKWNTRSNHSPCSKTQFASWNVSTSKVVKSLLLTAKSPPAQCCLWKSIFLFFSLFSQFFLFFSIFIISFFFKNSKINIYSLISPNIFPQYYQNNFLKIIKILSEFSHTSRANHVDWEWSMRVQHTRLVFSGRLLRFRSPANAPMVNLTPPFCSPSSFGPRDVLSCLKTPPEQPPTTVYSLVSSKTRFSGQLAKSPLNL